MAVKKNQFEVSTAKNTTFYVIRVGTMFLKADDINMTLVSDPKDAWELGTGAVRLPRAVRTLVFEGKPQPGIKAEAVMDSVHDYYGRDVTLMQCERTTRIKTSYSAFQGVMS